MIFKKKKKDFLERFPEIIWWEEGDIYWDGEYNGDMTIYGRARRFMSFTPAGYIYFKQCWGENEYGQLDIEKYRSYFINLTLQKRNMRSKYQDAKSDFQFMLDKVREEMKQLKERT